MTKFSGMIVVAALVLAFAAPAMAQTSPTTDAYGGVLGDQVANTGGGGGGGGGGGAAGEAGSPGSETVADSENVTAGAAASLPFTGLDVALIVLIGAALVGTGLALRPASRSTAP